MNIHDILRRLETAFFDFNVYIEGGEIYRYYGFQNAFVLITRMVNWHDSSTDILREIGKCFKLAEYMNEHHLKAFYIPRKDNPHNNSGFLQDCEELKFICSIMKSSMKMYCKYYPDCITDIESILQVENLVPTYELTPFPTIEKNFIPISDTEAATIKGGYRIAENRKTDFIKILTAMFECHFFERIDGCNINSKQDFFKSIGNCLNTSLTYYNNLMNKAKYTTEDTYMKPFEEIAEKAKERYDKV